MNIFQKYFLFIIFVIFITVPFLCSADSLNFEKIFYMSKSKEKEGIISLKQNADKIDIIAPQFYEVTEKLKIAGGLSANLKKVIKENKLKVMPLVANAGFKQSVMHNLLSSKKDQDAVIKGLIYLAQKNGYMGWQFDFENISYLDKDLYSIFVEKTAKAFHEKGLILSVAAVSRFVDYEDTSAFKNWAGVFDYARIAKAVDFISLMTYDDPNSVGPVASLLFVNNVLAYVKDKIPADKLSLGIPLYYWSWSQYPFKKVVSSGAYNTLLYIRANYDYNLGYSADLGTAWLSYSYKNKEYKIWYQDKQSFDARLDIIKQNGFRGFSSWVLGVEDPEIWSTLNITQK